MLGKLDISRDWGWAPEYVDAMWRMLQRDQPEDFVIATVETNRLEDFVEQAFKIVGLDWHEHVSQSGEFVRPTDLLIGRADPGKANRVLGWTANHRMRDVIRLMLNETVD